MRQRILDDVVPELLERADRILDGGGLVANVCRELGISHVTYERIQSKYGHVWPPPGRSGSAAERPGDG